ncbi:MAG TPA: ABC transporter permease [Acidimicrobiales bacterium]|nr:ABC transporter permease [Acidimicrobiales bacterium]
MTQFLSTLPGGLVTGAVYALLAMGLVLIYKATRIPNFAYGGMATFVAFFHYDLVNGRTYGLHFNALFVHVNWHPTVHLGFWAAVPVSLTMAALLGFVIERFVIRPFARMSTVTLTVVTLGLGLLLAAITQQLFGANDLIVSNDNAIFSRAPAFAIAGVNVSYERIGVIGIVAAFALLTFAFFRFTSTGLAIRAAATDPDVASLLGVSSQRLAIVSWIGGSIAAGIAGIALASLVVSSNPNLLTLLSIKGFAAAIVGGLVSFPIAAFAGFGIGIVEEIARHYLLAHNAKLFQGAPEVITLGAVIIVLAARPKWIFRGLRDDEDSGLLSRSGATDSRLARFIDPVEAYRAFRAAVPTTGVIGRFGKVIGIGVPVALGVFALVFPALPLPSFWTLPANFALIYLLIVLSFVVLVGWLGQISVAQGAFLAVGGAGVAICANALNLPFPLPLIGGVIFSIPVSILIGLPALRLRGLHLAVATLAFGLAAERAILPRFDASNRVVLPHWLDSDGARYYLILGLTALAFLVAWRISVSRVGRSFYAIRDSETVAAAYGIRPVRVKLTGFVVSGAISALAGGLLAYQLGGVSGQYGSVFFSITWLTYAVVAGIGSLGGPVIAALLFGLYPELTKGAVKATSISFWPEIIAAALLLVIMMVNPGGLASMNRFIRSRATAWDDVEDTPAPEVVAEVTA